LPGAVETLDELSVEAREAFVDLVSRIAACKHLLGERFAEWCTGAPSLGASVSAASMAQEELGHSRVFLGLARGIPETEAGEEEAAERDLVPSLLNEPFRGWLDFVAACLVADSALRLLLEAGRDASYAPLRHRVRKALDEEEFHDLYARGWAERLLAEGDPVAGRLRERVRAWRESVDAWLPSCEADLAALEPLGIRPLALRDELGRRVSV
jgi:1,2-phenylacetyl-CoA epoxidase catalytic subunit